MIDLNDTVTKHGKWIRGEDGGLRADLRGADLKGADLGMADLRNAYLTGADLRGVNLKGAKLRGAETTLVTLFNVDLGDYLTAKQ